MDVNKAAVLYGKRDIRIERREMPSLNPDEVLIKSMDVSICATEVKYWYYGMPNVALGTRVIQGHELGGIIYDAGKNVSKKYHIGSKAAIDPSLWCGVCDMCRAGMSNLCRNLQFMSLPPVDGGYQQFYKVPEKNIHLIPKEIEWASIIEPLSVGINAISDAEKITGTISDKNIAIIGAGPQGLLLMQTAAVLNRPRTICVLDILNYRLKLAEDLGADSIINPRTDNPLDIILNLTDGAGVDIAFEVAGEADTYQLAATLVKPGGTIVIIGIPVDQEYIPIQAITARRAGLTLKFIRRFNPKDFPKAINLMASGKVKCDKLITHSFPLDNITTAFEMLHAYSDGVVKAIICPHL